MSARPKPPTTPPDRPSDDAKTSIYDSTKRRRISEPIKAISMKAPDDVDKPAAPAKTPAMPRPKLRSLSDVTGPTPQNLGNLAPPFDPDAHRLRTMQDYIIWGCVAVIIASGIALVVWFVAR